MRRRFREWLEETHSAGFELVRHFLCRFFDGEEGTGSGESVKVIAGVIAALASVCLLGIKTYFGRYAILQSPEYSNPQLYRQSVREDLIAFIALAMALTALLTVLRWRLLFPTLADCLALAGLPVSARQVFTAKFSAVLLLFTAYILAVVPLPSGAFAMVAAGPWQEHHSFAINAAANFCALGGACAFVFFGLVGLQGILLNLLPARLFSRVSLFVQGTVFVAVLGSVPLLGSQPATAAWWPPVWFVRMWESIAANAPQTTARPGWIAVALAIAASVLTYLASYRRYQRILLESAPQVGRAARFAGSSWLLDKWIRNPKEVGAFSFITKTLLRSQRHRLILLTYAGLALGAVTKGALDMPTPSLRDEGLYGSIVVLAPLATALLLINALRYLFAVPEWLNANWVFRLAEADGRKAWLDAAERFVVWCGIVPVFVLSAPAALAVFYPLRAGAILVLDLLAAVLWFEVVFRNWDKVPFTCSYIPGKRPVVLILFRYALALPILVGIGQIILRGSADLASFMALFSLELAAVWRIRRWRRNLWSNTAIRFEDSDASAITPLAVPAAVDSPAPETATPAAPLFSSALVASRGWLPHDWEEEIAEERRSPAVFFATLLEDFRYGLRLVRRTPVLSAVIILTLTIGIGVNATVFAIVNGLALRPHVQTDPDSFVRIVAKTFLQNSPRSVSYGEYLNWQQNSRTVAQIAAWSDFMALIGDEDATGSLGMMVSCNLFTVDGADRAVAGRLLRQDDCATPGQVPSIVLSESLWRSRFGADPHVIGNRQRMNGRPVTIVGVARDGAAGWILPAPKVWAPLTAQPYFDPSTNNFENRESLWLFVAGRLAPGVSRSDAEAELNVLARQHDTVRRGRRTVVITTDGSWAKEIELSISGQRLMLIGFFLGAFNLVLLICCANVATLLLSRAAARRREIAVRLALGAARVRIVRMLVTESTVLAAFAGVASLVLTRYLPAPLYTAVAGHAPECAMAVDWRTFLYISVVVLVAGFLAGLAPALESLKIDLTGSLKGTASVFGVGGADRARGLLVAAQVSMSMVLLVEAGLFAQSEDRTLHRDPGYAPRSVVVAPLLFPDHTSPETVKVRLKAARELVQALPGVHSVAFSDNIPLWAPETVEVRPPSRRDALQPVDIYSASPNFFTTLKIPILRGREFNETDTDAAIVVSQTLASAFWPRADPVGRELTLPDGTATVVGVARDIDPARFGGSDNPVAYRNRRHQQTHAVMSVRFNSGIGQGGAMIRRTLQENQPGLFLIARILQDWIEQVTATLWNVVTFISILGVVATVLATTGIYAAVSFAVNQRTRDIGIRVALGATRFDIIREVLRAGGKPVSQGLLIGLWLSLAAAAGLQESVAGTPVRLESTAPLLYCAAAALLATAAVIAMFGPARRASRCNPSDALRCD